MKQTELIMGMPITIEIEGEHRHVLKKVFDYFRAVDSKFSPYKKDSEVSRFSRGEIKQANLSNDLKLIIKLCEETKKQTDEYFNPYNPKKEFDPSGIVKGWAIDEAGKILKKEGIGVFFIEAGGDVQVSGKKWRVGIRNPFNGKEIIKAIEVSSEGVATSGTYERGHHIYNKSGDEVSEIVSLTVIGPNVYEADRFATAAFAMERHGIYFIEKLSGLEGYMVDRQGVATMTNGFIKYVINQ